MQTSATPATARPAYQAICRANGVFGNDFSGILIPCTGEPPRSSWPGLYGAFFSFMVRRLRPLLRFLPTLLSSLHALSGYFLCLLPTLLCSLLRFLPPFLCPLLSLLQCSGGFCHGRVLLRLAHAECRSQIEEDCQPDEIA